MKNKFFFLATLFLFSFIFPSTSHAARPIYLGLAAKLELSQERLVADLKERFADPIQKMKPHVKAYYNYVVGHDSEFSLGLIVEAMDAQGEALLYSYSTKMQVAGFNGLSIRFRKVAHIEEQVSLFAGLHRGDGGDFDSNSETDKKFHINSVNAWEHFTDTLGMAFLSKNSADFRNYLTWFLGGSIAFSKFAESVLVHDDVVAANLNPSLVLEDGSKIDGESEMSPFFDVPFARNCWDSAYENGMCFSPKND